MVLVTEADFANLSLLQPNAALQRLLAGAKVVASDAMPPQVVTMNTEVALIDDAAGERRRVRVVFPGEAEAAVGMISVLEPLGMQLLGASVGCVIQCADEDGVRCLRIERIVYQPEHSLRTRLVTRR